MIIGGSAERRKWPPPLDLNQRTHAKPPKKDQFSRPCPRRENWAVKGAIRRTLLARPRRRRFASGDRKGAIAAIQSVLKACDDLGVEGEPETIVLATRLGAI